MRRSAARITASCLLLAGMVWLFVTEQCTSFTPAADGHPRIRHSEEKRLTPRRISTMSKSISSALESSIGKNDPTPTKNHPLSSYILIDPPSRLSSSAGSRDTTKLWKNMCPPLWNPKDTNDVTLVWSCCDDPQKVAIELLQRLTPGGGGNSRTKSYDPRMVENVAQSLEQFRDFCTEHILPTSRRSSGSGNDQHQTKESHHGYTFKARIVATRGPTGTKCPQWHVDHVPVRWIQSLVGPGCEMVVGNTDKGIHWNLVNGLDTVKNMDDEANEGLVVEESVQERNRALVATDVAEIYAAREQEAVLLIGNRWADVCQVSSAGADATIPPPGVHKSPTIPWGCVRVLLTQDIILDD